MFGLKKKKAKKDEALIKGHKEVARALELLFASKYVSRKHLYLENFIRGMMFSIGGVVGVTIGLGVILWILSLFDQVPLIGPVVDNVVDQIKSSDRVN